MRGFHCIVFPVGCMVAWYFARLECRVLDGWRGKNMHCFDTFVCRFGNLVVRILGSVPVPLF